MNTREKIEIIQKLLGEVLEHLPAEEGEPKAAVPPAPPESEPHKDKTIVGGVLLGGKYKSRTDAGRIISVYRLGPTTVNYEVCLGGTSYSSGAVLYSDFFDHFEPL